MFFYRPAHAHITPLNIRQSSDIYSRDKCEVWAPLWLREYFMGMSINDFTQKYKDGIQEPAKIFTQYLNPTNTGFSANEISEILTLKTRGKAGMESVYQYKNYKYRFWHALITHDRVVAQPTANLV